MHVTASAYITTSKKHTSQAATSLASGTVKVRRTVVRLKWTSNRPIYAIAFRKRLAGTVTAACSICSNINSMELKIALAILARFNPLTPMPVVTGRDEPCPFFHF